jgi:hypothetical protein
MSDPTYQKFVKRWEEVTDLPPQEVGKLTPFYKIIAKRLKVMPWPALVGLSLALVVGLYLLIGSAVTNISSILQRGF